MEIKEHWEWLLSGKLCQVLYQSNGLRKELKIDSVDGSGLLLIDDDIGEISKSQFLSHFLLFSQWVFLFIKVVLLRS